MTSSLDQLREVLKVEGIDVVLLDNMDCPRMEIAVEMRNKAGHKARVALEASGGVTLETVRSIALTGVERIAAYENKLLEYGTHALSEIPGLKLIGTAREKASVLSFVVDDVHPHDIGTILDQEGIAVRAGHHCAQPVMQRFNVPATARASFAFYNTKQEIEALVCAIEKVIEVFS